MDTPAQPAASQPQREEAKPYPWIVNADKALESKSWNVAKNSAVYAGLATAGVVSVLGMVNGLPFGPALLGGSIAMTAVSGSILGVGAVAAGVEKTLARIRRRATARQMDAALEAEGAYLGRQAAQQMDLGHGRGRSGADLLPDHVPQMSHDTDRHVVGSARLSDPFSSPQASPAHRTRHPTPEQRVVSRTADPLSPPRLGPMTQAEIRAATAPMTNRERQKALSEAARATISGVAKAGTVLGMSGWGPRTLNWGERAEVRQQAPPDRSRGSTAVGIGA